MSKVRRIPATLSEKSSWTPKNHAPSNEKIFEERMVLIKKWYRSWNEVQRWSLFEYVLKQLSDDQLLLLHSWIHPSIPPPDQDFTRTLPQFLSLRIFSLLDPQSLCRAAQVCWYWKYLTESNEIWKRKCLRLGWFLPSPSPLQVHDCTMWKRHYISCVSQLHWNPPQPPSDPDSEGLDDIDALMLSEEQNRKKNKEKENVNRHVVTDKAKKPWRDPDPCPKDTCFTYEIDTTNLPLYSRFPFLRRSNNADFTVLLPSSLPPPAPQSPPLFPPPTSLLHPTLLEKIRLGGSPSIAHIDLSTLNKQQTESEISETFYKLHNASPFPRLPPYFVHSSKNEDASLQYSGEVLPESREGVIGATKAGGIPGRPPSGRRSVVASTSTVRSEVSTSAGARREIDPREIDPRTCNKVNDVHLKEEGLLSKAWHIPTDETEDDY